MDTLNVALNLKDGSVAFRLPATISCGAPDRSELLVRPPGTAMPDVQFDSFGEPLPDSRVLAARPAGNASRWMLRIGTGLFWSLVVAILSARVLYFDPDFAAKFGQVAALFRPIATMLGV